VVSQRIERIRQTELSHAQVAWSTQISPDLARVAEIAHGSGRITMLHRQGRASHRGTGPQDGGWKPLGEVL
jgi:hypothetical protein